MTSQDRASSGASAPSSGPRNIDAVLETINEFWSPRTFAVVNDYDVRLVKVRGEFTRHSHPDTDEFFLVLSGSLTIKLDGEEVVLAPSDSYVVPRGTYHQPIAPTETAILLFEPRETVNTGDTPSPLTAERRVVWHAMTHRSRLTAIGIDVPPDVPEVATRFWRSAFGSDHDGPAQAGYASIGRERGLDVFIQALEAGGPRIDLDIETDDVDAEVRRLEALGATRAQRLRTWWVMHVPVGLLFCVVQPQHDDFPGRDSHEWPNA